jgi:hypothetical protein
MSVYLMWECTTHFLDFEVWETKDDTLGSLLVDQPNSSEIIRVDTRESSERKLHWRSKMVISFTGRFPEDFL